MYDTDGGSEVPAQKIRYGEFITEPETPYKPGYTFDGWYTEKEGETVLWYFQSEKVTGDMTLTAHWIPAQFTVKFDYDGGTDADGAVTESKQVILVRPMAHFRNRSKKEASLPAGNTADRRSPQIPLSK